MLRLKAFGPSCHEVSDGNTTGGPKMPDYQIDNYGSVFLFTPMNGPARQHLKDHTDGQWFGSSLAVEHRYAPNLASALQDDGFTVA